MSEEPEEEKDDRSKEIRLRNKVVRENHLDFLEDLHNKGVELDPESLMVLRQAGRIDEGEFKRPKRKKTKTLEQPTVRTEFGEEADKFVDIIYEDDDDGNTAVDSLTFQERQNQGLFKYEGGKEITKDDWRPTSVIHHTKEFVRWVDSFNSGFQNMIKYRPFQLYCQQASDWLADDTQIIDFNTLPEQREYAQKEFRRCKENTLYFLDKYLMLREGDMDSGSMKYDSKPAHKVMCFLFDAGYSTMTGKGRQMAATTTFAGCALAKTIFNKNFFIKMIAQDKEKVIEIFDDKIKFPFSELPEWMKPTVSNDRDNLFRLSKKSKKGSKGGVNSKIQVVAPSVAAINGGAPPLVMIDEAGYIGILGKMMKEARPTMFMQDQITKKIQMKRQIIIWGTGGEMDKGGKSYEEEFKKCLDAWKKREFEYGIIPIFFDWTTRPGATQEHYDNEKRAYTVEGPDKEAKMVQFRQHYPSTFEDMFLTSEKTLVSIDWINEQLDRIYGAEKKHKPIHGFFEPLYDTTKVADENSDVPFKVIGAEFVQTDELDPRKSVTMFMPPERNWVNRYYQGTDPIMSDNGYSNMASAIFDAHYKTIAAIVDYRDSNHKYTFLQNMLLGLYYDVEKKGGVPELVESNIGTAYVDYKDSKGFYNSLVNRTELPEHMQGGSALIGIDNRGNRTKFIINKMFEVLKAYGGRFYIDTIFIQLRTFTCTVTEKGTETWGTSDKRKYHDDVLFAITFAYICHLCYDYKVPKKIESEQDKYRMRYKLVRDAQGNLKRKQVKERIRYD